MDSRKAVTLAVAITSVLLLLVLTATTGFPRVPGAVTLFLAVFSATVLLVVAGVVHALTRDDLGGAQRLAWLAVIVLVTPGFALGALAYFIMGRERTARLFADLGPRTAPPAPPAS